MAHIVIIEGDSEISELISWEIKSLGHTVELFDDPQAGLVRALKMPLDVVLVSPDLFDFPPRQVAATLRSSNSDLRVLMLINSPHSPEELGVDATLVKPFSVKELLTKVKQLLRMRATGSSSVIRVGDLTLELELGLIQIAGGAPQPLQPKDAALLQLLMENPGLPSSKETLLREVWGFDTKLDESAVTEAVGRLNRTISQAGAPLPYIRSAFGVGYRLLSVEEIESGVVSDEDDMFDIPEEDV